MRRGARSRTRKEKGPAVTPGLGLRRAAIDHQAMSIRRSLWALAYAKREGITNGAAVRQLIEAGLKKAKR